MKRYTLGLALLGLAGPAFAQSETDALRFARHQFGGPARTQAIGGANVALGADLGNLSSNPAGLGLFQRSEISFTPGLHLNSADARVNNVTGSPSLNNTRNALHLGSLGGVFANRLADSDQSSDWRGGALAVGFTRLNDFNSNFSYRSNIADDRSVMQRFREPQEDTAQIFGEYDDEVYTTLDGLAYGASLTALNRQGRIVTISELNRSGPVDQRENVSTRGGQSQFDIGYGASYRDRLYVGAAFGIVSTRYREIKELSESYEGADSKFRNLTLRDEANIRGSGVNLRAGLIYRANDWVRVGASVQTPTFGSQTITYATTLTTRFSQPLNLTGSRGETVEVEPAQEPYTYAYTAPWRASSGAAVVLGKYGFLSGDVEYVNYGAARLNEQNSDGSIANSSYFDDVNAGIRDLYQSVVNLRLGGEARLGIFRLRGGYARYGDPYRSSRYDRTQTYYTGGLGVRQGNLTLDLTGVYGRSTRVYSPYTLVSNNQPEVTVDNSRVTTAVTLGWQF